MNWYAFFIGYMLGSSMGPGIGFLWGYVAGAILFPPEKKHRG